MAKRLTALGSTGLVAIAEPGANLANPLQDLGNIYFHSDLTYLSVVAVLTGNLSLPQRIASGADVSSAFGSNIYTLGQHNLGYTPLLLGDVTTTGQPLVGETLLQAEGLASLRSITLGADNNNLYAREIYLNKDVTFEAISVSWRAYLFSEAAV